MRWRSSELDSTEKTRDAVTRDGAHHVVAPYQDQWWGCHIRVAWVDKHRCFANPRTARTALISPTHKAACTGKTRRSAVGRADLPGPVVKNSRRRVPAGPFPSGPRLTALWAPSADLPDC